MGVQPVPPSLDISNGLAKAYVIDPSNNELKRAEVRIRQQEIRHHQAAAQPLTLVYHHERVANAE